MKTKTKIIAEVSSNHGGDIKLAKEFIRIASDIGVDYIKFQSWQASKLSKDDPQYDWFVKSELSDSAHFELIEECNKRNIKFLTTVFDIERIDFLKQLGLKEVKVASPDAGSYRLLNLLKGNFDHIVVSTGMHYMNEIEKAAEILAGTNFTFLHCTSIYPTPNGKVNLEKMQWLKRFTPSVGYSDHSIGIDAVKIAIAQRASYVEKHFCLGKEGPGRVMPWDAIPEQMAEVVRFAEIVYAMLGDIAEGLSEDELKAREKFVGRFGNNR